MGKLFVIEGTDSSGKQTQLEKLKNRFEKENIKYKSVSFPNYESNSSELVKIYLKGELGDDPKKISPYTVKKTLVIRPIRVVASISP